MSDSTPQSLAEKTMRAARTQREQIAGAEATGTQLRDTLFPSLISGQLHLPEAEALTEEAV